METAVDVLGFWMIYPSIDRKLSLLILYPSIDPNPQSPDSVTPHCRHRAAGAGQLHELPNHLHDLLSPVNPVHRVQLAEAASASMLVALEPRAQGRGWSRRLRAPLLAARARRAIPTQVGLPRRDPSRGPRCRGRPRRGIPRAGSRHPMLERLRPLPAAHPGR
jgi:hypothetical protein